MDIAAMSIDMSLARVQQAASVSVAKNAMDIQETAAQDLLKMMESVPSFGHTLDIRA